MLSENAMTQYKEFTKQRIANARYKVGSTQTVRPIDRVETLADGRVAFYATIPPGQSGVTVTELALLDTSGQVFFQKALTGDGQIKITSASEGALIRFAFTFRDASES